MRVECEACHELVAASFAVEGSAVRAVCPVCGHAMRATPVPASPVEGAQCPKCGAARREDAVACATCGLTSERMAAFAAAREAAAPPVLQDAWQRTCEAWGEAARHDDLFRLAAQHDGYAWVAARYRTRGRDAMAVRQLERLRRAAEATLLAGASARPDTATRPYRASVGVLAIFIVA